MRAAVPEYVGTSFVDCPPGHRFSLYFPVWKDNWSLDKEGKVQALKQTLSLPRHAQDTLAALRERQAMLLDGIPEVARLSIEAQSTAPFATGLGLAHPLENGFAFLNPYGLPYLPGSSIKGVLRRAAEELAGELIEHDRKGWTPEAITALFGLESEDHQKEHLRGALIFWDALPKPANNCMGMEVMTPHYGDYYQAKRTDTYRDGVTPHDAGQPNPIVFLVVPAGSKFSFHVTCDATRLTANQRDTWQALVRAAFEHAFDWLGFGAKTAVGYGAMQIQEHSEENHAPNAVPHVPAQATPQVETGEKVWSSAELHYNPSTREITASFEGKKSAGLTGEALERLLTALGERTVKLKKNKKLNNIPIRVCIQGNLIKIIGLANEGV